MSAGEGRDRTLLDGAGKRKPNRKPPTHIKSSVQDREQVGHFFTLFFSYFLLSAPPSDVATRIWLGLVATKNLLRKFY